MYPSLPVGPVVGGRPPTTRGRGRPRRRRRGPVPGRPRGRRGGPRRRRGRFDGRDGGRSVRRVFTPNRYRSTAPVGDHGWCPGVSVTYPVGVGARVTLRCECDVPYGGSGPRWHLGVSVTCPVEGSRVTPGCECDARWSYSACKTQRWSTPRRAKNPGSGRPGTASTFLSGTLQYALSASRNPYGVPGREYLDGTVVVNRIRWGGVRVRKGT